MKMLEPNLKPNSYDKKDPWAELWSNNIGLNKKTIKSNFLYFYCNFRFWYLEGF